MKTGIVELNDDQEKTNTFNDENKLKDVSAMIVA
jgi:hypothetical protein